MIPAELADMFLLIQDPDTRIRGLSALANYTNAGQALLFGKDPEINAMLPAQGLPQTLRHGAMWRSFLEQCAAQGSSAGTLPDPASGLSAPAFGIADRSGSSVLVFLGFDDAPSHLQEVAALLPLVGIKIATERTALSAAGHAAVARAASEHARQLNQALDASRRELQIALERAELELNTRRSIEAKLLETDRRKDEFLAMLAHELRNPLAPIRTAALIAKTALVDKKQLHAVSEIIERQVKHMTSLLDDLLDVARVTRGQIALSSETVEVKSILSDAIEQTRALFEARSHRLTVRLAKHAAWVCGDRVRLVQVIANLLNNAAKYTPHSGDIELAMNVSQSQVAISVKDNGIGISSDLMPRVFELFTQAERSADRSQGGLGIGLALVKNLVELQGGSVQVRSEGPGKGSEFVVALPRQSDTTTFEEPSAGESALLGRNASMSIMVVDDNVDAARTLEFFLSSLGHSVAVAYDATTALKIVESRPLSLCILDIGLPGMDGYELAQTLRGLSNTKDAKLVALTGYCQPDDKAKSLDAGFDHHLVKPIDPAIIVKLLQGETP